MKKKYADMDPIEELRAIREELSREFPTTKALCDYFRKNFPVTNPAPPAPTQRKGQRTSAKAKPNTRPAARRRKSAAHTE
ncbi:MAG: hypothetical protein FWE88_08070 [Phycisphaerae bacterium]|nr:hypothetical protein [Phycisphaerae bacterium]